MIGLEPVSRGLSIPNRNPAAWWFALGAMASRAGWPTPAALARPLSTTFARAASMSASFLDVVRDDVMAASTASSMPFSYALTAHATMICFVPRT